MDDNADVRPPLHLKGPTVSYRDALPQLDGGVFLTDAGLETELIFHDGIDLPAFAAFDLLKDEAGTARLKRYYEAFADLAIRESLGDEP